MLPQSSSPRTTSARSTPQHPRFRARKGFPSSMALGSKEAEMRMMGCDLHAAQQTIAILDPTTQVDSCRHSRKPRFYLSRIAWGCY